MFNMHTDIRKTLTPWSSVSMAVTRTLFSLALSTCIWAQSLVLRINRRLPWVLITATQKQQLGTGAKDEKHHLELQ